MYQTLLRPYVAKHETDIDRKLLELRARAWDLAVFYWQNCAQMGHSAFFQTLQYLASQSSKFTKTPAEEVGTSSTFYTQVADTNKFHINENEDSNSSG